MKAEELALRKRIISFHKKKKPTREIAYLLDISKSKVAFWVKRYKDAGSLENKPRSGRPTPLTKHELNSIAGSIKSNLLESKSNKHAGVSSKEVLHLIEHKIKHKYTLRHIQRLLHKMGFSLITPRVNHIRKDEKAQEKFRREFKKNSNKHMWAIPS